VDCYRKAASISHLGLSWPTSAHLDFYRNFGKTAPYEFTSSRFNVGELRKQAQKLEDEQKKSKRKVNTKVMGMLEMYVYALSFGAII
jgi:hypothetical protein